MSTLAQIIGQSESNTVEQSSTVLDAVADYSTDLATFVASSDIVINDTVRENIKSILWKIYQVNAHFLYLCRLLMIWSR